MWIREEEDVSMHAVFEKKELSSAVNKVVRGITNKPVKPILTGISLDADSKGFVTLTAMDLEEGVSVICPAKVEKAGKAVLPGKVLANIARSSKGKDVAISVSEDYSASVEAGSSFYRLSAFSPDEFPIFPSLSEDVVYTVDADSLKRAVSLTHFAVSKDEMRPALTGLLLNIQENDADIVATDGHRLSVGRLQIKNGSVGKGKFIIPSRVAVEVARILQGGDVEVVLAEGRVLFRFENVSFFSRLIEGDYPDYQSLLQEEFISQVSLSREEFAGLLERVSLVFREEGGIVTLRMEDDSLEVRGETQEMGEAREKISARIQGKRIEVAYNAKYLAEAVRVAPWDEIEMGIRGEVAPTKVFGKDKEFEYILMPLRKEEEV